MIDLLEKIRYNNIKIQMLCICFALYMEDCGLKILVVFTGGTIGSTIMDGYAVPDENKKYRLIRMYEENVKGHKRNGVDKNVEFYVESPYQELSENNTCMEIFKLASYLNEKINKCKSDNNYDGIIITHGTDTLQYTAAGLSYMFADSDIPIILVSSNYVLDDKRANGLTNFAYAVKFIEGKYGTGVFVSYCNTNKNPVIHRGTRLMEHTAYSDDVLSVKNAEYGYFEDGLFVKKITNDNYDKLFVQSTGICSQLRSVCLSSENKGNPFTDIQLIKPFPGMRYKLLSDEIKAVLHVTYHSGTICSKSPDLAEFAMEVNNKRIPVYVLGAGDSVDYDSVKIYGELGFEVLDIAVLPAMLVKLWLGRLIFQDNDKLSEFMRTDVAGDINLDI